MKENVIQQKSFLFAVRIKLLKETDYISKNEFESIYNEAEEICKILAKIIITLKGKIQGN